MNARSWLGKLCNMANVIAYHVPGETWEDKALKVLDMVAYCVHIVSGEAISVEKVEGADRQWTLVSDGEALRGTGFFCAEKDGIITFWIM